MSDVTDAKTTESEDDASLEDALGAAFDTLSSDDAGEEDALEVKEPVAEAGDDEARVEAADDEPDDGEDDADTASEADTAAGPEAPDDWIDADREHFAKLDTAGREWVLARDGEIREALSERDLAVAKAEKGSELDAVVESIRPGLEMAGLEPAPYMKRLVTIGQAMDRDPAGTIRWLATQYQIDPNTISDQSGDENDMDPMFAARLQPLEQSVNSLSAYVQQQRQASEQQQTSAVTSAIDLFQLAKDEKGQAVFPYFERVKGQMSGLLNSDPNLAAMTDYPKALEIAYDRAVRLDDDLWKQTLARERQTGSTTIAASNKAEVSKAKKATGGNVKTRNRPGSERSDPAESDDLRGAISRSWDELTAA